MIDPAASTPLVTISRPSVASLYIQMLAREQPLATGTAFVVERGRRTFLITNRHNVRGRRNDDDRLLSATGAEPDALVVLQNQRGQLGAWVPQPVRLRDDDGRSLWHEHPVLFGKADVVAVEIEPPAEVDLYPHDPWASGPAIAVNVSSALSIVGFPFGVTGGGAFGVWVQGTVATEPRLDWRGLPCFLIDSRTRPGQSGSPVLMYSAGGMTTMDDGSTVVSSGPQERFLGVYSGRISAESDLGIVWRASVVAEIVDAVVDAAN